MAEIIDSLLNAIALHRDGDFAGASRLCRAVLDDEPEQEVALHLLGVIASAQGEHGAALDLLRRAASLRPENAETRLALGNALTASGDPAAAVGEYRLVTTAQPTHLAALVNMAHALLLLDQPSRAVTHLQRAVAAHPRAARAQCGLATALLRVSEPAPALEAASAALVLAPDMEEAWFAAGTALSALGRSTEAIAALDRAVALSPDHAMARLNRGNALLDLDRIAAAERDMRAALALDPALAEGHASLGFLLAGSGRLDAAVAACSEAIRLRPGFARAYWNRSFAHMLAGDYPRGWDDYEWRRHDRKFADDFLFLTGPEWQGEDLAGRHLLVHAQQGLGDTIQLARYLPLLAARAARVTLSCAAPLHRLLSQLPVAVVDRTQPAPPFDLWVDQMSLPRLFGTTPDNIPSAEGYLRRAECARAPGKPRVGIVGAGNPQHSNDRRRSLAPAALAPLAAVPGIAWTSLLVGPRSAEQAALFGVADLSDALVDFAATAEIVAGLDLVIAVDTSTAHLAGAMGVPVWIMLPAAADWRWITGRSDTPWYSSARLFRQPSAGDWDCVVADVAAALETLRDS